MALGEPLGDRPGDVLHSAEMGRIRRYDLQVVRWPGSVIPDRPCRPGRCSQRSGLPAGTLRRRVPVRGAPSRCADLPPSCDPTGGTHRCRPEPGQRAVRPGVPAARKIEGEERPKVRCLEEGTVGEMPVGVHGRRHLQRVGGERHGEALGGPRDAEARGANEFDVPQVVQPARIAERRDWSASDRLQGVLAGDDLVPGLIGSETRESCDESGCERRSRSRSPA